MIPVGFLLIVLSTHPTQNHLVNSTLPIFILSTLPSIMPGCKHPKTKKSESRKRTPNSRKCLVFKPFSVFTSVLLTSTLRTPRGSTKETYPLAEPPQLEIPSLSKKPNPLRGSLDCRIRTQSFRETY